MQREDTYRTYKEGAMARFKCPAYPGDPVLKPDWHFNGMSLSHRHHREQSVYLRIDRISMEDQGKYICSYNLPTGYFENYVNVTVTPDMREPTKPIFYPSRIDRAEIVVADELKDLVKEERTMNTPHAGSAESVRIEWKRKDSGELVDFGTRLDVLWDDNRLRWFIRSAMLTDNGQYHMNVSNDYGSTVLLTTLSVTEVKKSDVYIRISGQRCELLKVRGKDSCCFIVLCKPTISNIFNFVL